MNEIDQLGLVCLRERQLMNSFLKRNSLTPEIVSIS